MKVSLTWAISMLLIGAIVLVVGGCYSDPYEDKGNEPQIGHGYYVVRLPWKGRTVDCIKWAPGGEHHGGLSCDFNPRR